MKSEYLSASHGQRGLRDFLQKDGTAGSGCIHRVLPSSSSYLT
jgi:hypothetical protein